MAQQSGKTNDDKGRWSFLNWITKLGAKLTAPVPSVGTKRWDSTIFAGISPDTNQPMYTTPADAPGGTYTFNEAAAYAAKLDAYGHQDWRVPTNAELNVLFNNRAAIGGFNLTGSYPAGWYWSASQNGAGPAHGQRFEDGSQDTYGKGDHSSLRCIRFQP